MSLRTIFLLIILFSTSPAQRNRRKQKFVRLPSGYTFPADSANNFQGESFTPYTFPPPSEKIMREPPRYVTGEHNSDYTPPSTNSERHGMNYNEYKNAMSHATPEPTIPPPTEVHSPGMPVDYTTIAPGAASTSATMRLKKDDVANHVNSLSADQQQAQRGHTFTALGGGQFYQSLLGGKTGGFSPLNYFLNGGIANGRAANNGFFVPVPVVIPPPPPPPPGPKCFTNPSGFLCCNVTLEKTMEEAYLAAKAEGISSCNVQKMATAVQAGSEKKFGTSFESIAAHKDFVAKINFAGDLNCKIEIDGKYILAYATPLAEQEVNIVDAGAFFSGAADKELEGVNGTKPTYIVYGPVK